MSEPVAWMIKTLDGRKLMLYGEEQPPEFEQEVQSIPLYTHPIKELKLTKSEIETLWEKHCPFDLTGGIAFAKAILRKASKK